MSWRCLNFFNVFKSLFINKSITKMPFYAVARGRTAGIFMNWADCEAQVKGFPGARYKKFNTTVDAEKFITSEGSTSTSQKYKLANHTKRNTRSHDTISTSHEDSKPKIKTATKRPSKISKDKTDSDEDSDNLNLILTKQMDDIEERIKGFERGVDNIIKKNSKSIGKTILIDPPQIKKRKSGKLEFTEDQHGYVQVYTDGACSSNGKSSARAGIGVYWADGHPLNVSEPVAGRATNNCGEIQAATCAIKHALQNNIKNLAINTDSQFLINSVTKWMSGWKRKGWKLQSGEPVKNEKDFKELDKVQNKLQIKWNYVEAHKGVHGNEMADQLAKAGAARYTK